MENIMPKSKKYEFRYNSGLSLTIAEELLEHECTVTGKEYI